MDLPSHSLASFGDGTVHDVRAQNVLNAVAHNVAGVAQAANETGAAASPILAAASDLSSQARLLSGEVDRFLGSVRAA